MVLRRKKERKKGGTRERNLRLKKKKYRTKGIALKRKNDIYGIKRKKELNYIDSIKTKESGL